VKIEKIFISVLVALILFANMSFYIFPAHGQLENYVFIEPVEPPTAGISPYAIAPGQTVLVNITIQNALNIYGYNLTFSWSNSTIVEYVDYQFHPFLNEPYTTKITQKGGKITVYARSHAPASPVNGTGVLVTLNYTGVNIGESLINFDALNCWLILQNGTEIRPSTFKRGKLAVTDTKIAVEPQELSGMVETHITANITVYNVVDLYGIEFNLTWNPEILTLTKVHYQVPWSNKHEVKNETGPGYYTLAVSGMYPATAYTGNYTFVNMEFTITKIGLTPIKFQYSKFGDIKSKPIPHAKFGSTFSNIRTKIGFNPSVIADVSLTPGKSFAVNLTITEAVNLTDFNIRISYPEILNFSSITFNEAYLIDYNFTSDPITKMLDVTGSFSEESTGNFSVAVIEFQVVGFGSEKIIIVESASSLKDGEGTLLLFKTSPCKFINWRNVRITFFDLASSVRLGNKFAIGEPVTVSVEVENIGVIAENVSLVVKYEGNVTTNGNSTIVCKNIYNETLYLEKFESQNSSKLVTFVWNTTDLEAGVYHVTVNATIEIDNDLDDNAVTKTLGFVKYTIDISIVNVLITPMNIPVNGTATLAVIVKNLGLTTQTFNLLIYLDGELIEKFENVTLMGDSGDIFFVTLPRFPEPGEHQLNCTIPALSGEVPLQNNVYLKVLRVGLVTAQFPFEMVAVVVVVIIFVLAVVILSLKRRRF